MDLAVEELCSEETSLVLVSSSGRSCGEHDVSLTNPLSSLCLPSFSLFLFISSDSDSAKIVDLSGGGDELLRAASIDLAAVPSTKYERRGGLTDAEKKDRLNRQKKESKQRRIKKLDKPNTETVLSGLTDAEKKERLNRQKLESKWRKRTDAMVKNTPSAGSKQSASKQHNLPEPTSLPNLLWLRRWKRLLLPTMPILPRCLQPS